MWFAQPNFVPVFSRFTVSCHGAGPVPSLRGSGERLFRGGEEENGNRMSDNLLNSVE